MIHIRKDEVCPWRFVGFPEPFWGIKRFFIEAEIGFAMLFVFKLCSWFALENCSILLMGTAPYLIPRFSNIAPKLSPFSFQPFFSIE